MTSFNRRRFLASGAASLAAPALALAQGSGALDAIIVGAGAAGIAAARRLAAAGRRCVVVEAANRVGGRCSTDTETFGLPFDRGGRLLYAPEVNPVARLARAANIDITPVRAGHRLRIGERFAREGEMETHFAALVRARRAIEDAGSEEEDIAAARALPRDLGDWRATVEFVLGPYRCGKGLEAVSARDLARSADRDLAGVSRSGCGALLAALAADLPIRLSTPASRVAVWRNSAYVDTPRGMLQAQTAIVTVPTDVIASGAIRFDPMLPKSYADAFEKLSLGTHERVALELPGNPLGLGSDEVIFEQAKGVRTAALVANVGGTPLSFIEIPGPFGRDLVKQGEAAMVAFAVDWLTSLFGAHVRKSVRRTGATRWSVDPLALGSASVASVGADGARKALGQPLRDRVFLAGEATHETLWGTIGGAWESGERAANAALRQMSAPSRRKR